VEAAAAATGAQGQTEGQGQEGGGRRPPCNNVSALHIHHYEAPRRFARAFPAGGECNLIQVSLGRLFAVVLNPSRHSHALPCSLYACGSPAMGALLVSGSTPKPP